MRTFLSPLAILLWLAAAACPETGQATDRSVYAAPAVAGTWASPAFAALKIDRLPTSPSWYQVGGQINASYGRSVATVGDVNGDGYSDVVVGAALYDAGETDEGRALLYLGTASGLSTSPAWTGEGNQAGALFGACVAPAGDVNADGYDDLIVSASHHANGQWNEGRVFVYLGSASGLQPNPIWTAEGNQIEAYFGFSVSTAGDVNGDGYCDILVGAIGYDNGQTDEGRVYLYLGTDTGVSATPAWTGEGDQASAQYGYAVGAAGDVDGDGYADIIVGANLFDIGAADRGQAYLYRGSPLGVQGAPIWVKAGMTAGDCFGAAVSTAGDVNGDGYADIIVGAPLAHHPFTGMVEGRAYLFLGSGTGPSTTASWTGMGGQAGAQFGWSVGPAGDVDGDGFADVIIGANLYDNGQTDEGKVLVYQGSIGGLSTSASWTTEMDQEDARFGSAVATAGDINGDGFSDIVIGACLYNAPLLNEGAAWVYNGSAQGLAADPAWTVLGDREDGFFGASVRCAGDIDGDGYSDVLAGAPMTTGVTPDYGRAFLFRGSSGGLSETPDWTATGEQQLDLFGGPVSGAGDVNGDGYSDVIVGANRYSPNGITSAGRVYVYHGSSTGLPAAPDWIVTGASPSACLGRSASSAGDVNGDGYADVIIGARGSGYGVAYVYLGSADGLSAMPSWQIAGGAGSEAFGQSVSTAGDVNGDGYSDVIVGAPALGVPEPVPGHAFVYLGSASGLSTTPVWTGTLGQDGDWYGIVVSTAGDVNGDGFDDIVVGADLYEQAGYPTNSGAVAVYLGSAAGVQESIEWFVWGNQENGNLGDGVGAAGDVNGDGYSDVAFGAGTLDNPLQDSGTVWVKLGSSTGLSGLAEWTDAGDEGGVYLGVSLGTAGDVNGDGYDDLVVGGPGRTIAGITHAGSAYTYLGNGRTASAPGLALVPGQLKAGEGTIDWLGMSDMVDQFRLRAEGRSAAGRCRVRLEWNVAELGASLLPIVHRGAWHMTSAPLPGIGSVVTETETVGSLGWWTPYHWRLRVGSDSPFFPHTPWMSMARTVPSETQLRTFGSPCGVEGDAAGVVTWASLEVVRPNPFTRQTAIVVDLPSWGPVELSIFDLAGRQVRRLLNGELAAGRQVVRWDGRDGGGGLLPNGVYHVRLASLGTAQSRKIVLTR